MGIKVEVTKQFKSQMANLVTECQVLNNLLTERRAALDNKAKEILTTNAMSTNLYGLKFNLAQDLWEAQLKQGKIILPSEEVKQVKLN